jgi:thiol-disulfide isomerase/thioredoxin
MPRHILKLLWLCAFLSVPLLLSRPVVADCRLRVVDERDAPVAKFDAMVHTADEGYTLWKAGKAGSVMLDHIFRESKVVDVLVRADGYASTVSRFAGQELDKLHRGEVTVTMQRGRTVELRFRLPEGLVVPRDLLMESYFDDFKGRVRMMRQPSNRRAGIPDIDMLNLRPSEPGRFTLELTPQTPPFFVAIHAPGFLQQFEAGPFTLADVKQGILEIDVPRRATLEVQFDMAAGETDTVPFSGVSCDVSWQHPGSKSRYLDVASTKGSSLPHKMRMTDLAPGVYRVSVATTPKPDVQNLPETMINPGAYHDHKTITLAAGQTEHIAFQAAPVNLAAFRGNRTAVVRVLTPEGKPAAGRQIVVGYFDGHYYGSLPVFSGKVPESGEVVLKDITDHRGSDWPFGPYSVTVDGKPLGSFGFTSDVQSQEFVMRMAPRIGDIAPNVELFDIVTGKSVKLNELRGKVVLLEFWATWCGPCQPAMQKLSELAGEQADAWRDRVSLVGVSIDDEPAQAKQHIQQRGWNNLDHYWSGAEGTMGFPPPALRAFVGSAVPDAVLIDAQGRILWRSHPMDTRDGQTLQERIEAALKK